MNNGKMWTVVNPTVGIPALLGGVALISFTIHFAVLENTTWFPAFFG
ncbi:MAG: light-harvesting protein [Pseudomonadota bacterium]